MTSQRKLFITYMILFIILLLSGVFLIYKDFIQQTYISIVPRNDATSYPIVIGDTPIQENNEQNPETVNNIVIENEVKINPDEQNQIETNTPPITSNPPEVSEVLPEQPIVFGPETPIDQKVLSIVYYSGHNPTSSFDYNYLINDYRFKLNESTKFKSYSYPSSKQNVNFRIIQNIVLEKTAPQKGTNCDQYLEEIHSGQWTTQDWQATNCWGSGTANYNQMLEENDVCTLVNAGTIDEVWIWGFGNGGFWEANMAGSGAYWTNGPVIENTNCNNAVHVMGFNYELPADYALHSMGHRIEGSMHRYLSSEFASFTVYSAGGSSSCGNIHFPPNGQADYDYNNSISTNSDCKDWNVNHTGNRSSITCSEWGCTQGGFMQWWLKSIPGTNNNLKKFDGSTMPNWWKIITKNQI